MATTSSMSSAGGVAQKGCDWAICRSLNVPHVVPDVLHRLCPQILCWAAVLVATPQQQFPTGSPTHFNVQHMPTKKAFHSPEASTVLICKQDLVGQIADVAPTSMGTGVRPSALSSSTNRVARCHGSVHTKLAHSHYSCPRALFGRLDCTQNQ